MGRIYNMSSEQYEVIRQRLKEKSTTYDDLVKQKKREYTKKAHDEFKEFFKNKSFDISDNDEEITTSHNGNIIILKKPDYLYKGTKPDVDEDRMGAKSYWKLKYLKGKSELQCEILLKKIEYKLLPLNNETTKIENAKKNIESYDNQIKAINNFYYILKLPKDYETIKIDDSEEFKSMQIEYLEKGISTCSNYYKCPTYSKDEQAALDIVMDKFNKWHFPRIEYCAKTLEIICFSKFYVDYNTKAAAVLDMYIGTFVDSINDAEQTLNELNGNLKGLKFRGIEM
jgi:hypothetical protein